MASHFREDVERTKRAPRRQRVQDGAGQYTRSPSARSSYTRSQPSRPVTAPRDDYYFEDQAPSVGDGFRAVGRGLFLMLAWVARIGALALFVIVMLNAIPIPPIKYHVSYATDLLTTYLPWNAWGALAVDTPFSGTFRCDLCLVSLLLFFVDWVFCRIRAALV